MFLTGCISKTIYGNYEWTNKAGWEKVKQEKIILPVRSDGKIDFNFMESFIAELEAERVAELEAYLKVSGFDDYELSDEEKQAIDNYSRLEWKEYKLGDLFDVVSSTKKFDANKVTVKENGKYPYIVRMCSNNGQKGAIDEDEKYLNDGNTISFGQDTATMFYQEKSYFTGDKIKILKSKNIKFNKSNALFFLAALRKPFLSFFWGTSFNSEIIKRQKIQLSVKNGKLDYEFMSVFISAIQKLVIKDVTLYKNKKIESTKKIVRK